MRKWREASDEPALVRHDPSVTAQLPRCPTLGGLCTGSSRTSYRIDTEGETVVSPGCLSLLTLVLIR